MCQDIDSRHYLYREGIRVSNPVKWLGAHLQGGNRLWLQPRG